MFVEEYLQDLRRERFAPRALHRYGRRVIGRVREQIYANPGAVRSIWSVALGFFAAAFLIAVAIALVYDRHLAYDFFVLTSASIRGYSTGRLGKPPSGCTGRMARAFMMLAPGCSTFVRRHS